jgi:hypothetical protein
MRIFDLHTSKARNKLKVVLLHIWSVNVRAIGGFINIPLADLPHINVHQKYYDTVGRPRQYLN